MRIKYPKEITDELELLREHLTFNGKEWIVKPDAPKGIQERYAQVREKMHAIRGD